MARMPRAARFAVTAAYAAQALGYAVLVTSLPALKARQQVDDTTISLILLGVSVAAALGSILADLVSVRWGSRAALATGLVIEAALLPVVAVQTPFAVFVGALAVYGVICGKLIEHNDPPVHIAERSFGSVTVR